MSVPGSLEDSGDVTRTDDSAAMRADVERRVGELRRDGRTPVILGGDHSITYPVLRAFRGMRDVTVVHFDAHSDLYDEFEGDRYSHACPFARIMEEGLAKRLVQVGVRTLTGHQRDQADRFGVEIVQMKDWATGGRLEVSGPIYLSCDIDVLDPAFAPGVSHHEPGGMTTRELIGAIQSLPAGIVGADVVELNPSRDVNGVTAMVCAKIVKEIADRILSG